MKQILHYIAGENATTKVLFFRSYLNGQPFELRELDTDRLDEIEILLIFKPLLLAEKHYLSSLSLYWKWYLHLHKPEAKVMTVGFRGDNNHENYLDLLNLPPMASFSSRLNEAKSVKNFGIKRSTKILARKEEIVYEDEWEKIMGVNSKGRDLKHILTTFFDGHSQDGIEADIVAYRQKVHIVYYNLKSSVWGYEEILRVHIPEIIALLNKIKKRWGEEYMLYFQFLPFLPIMNECGKELENHALFWQNPSDNETVFMEKNYDTIVNLFYKKLSDEVQIYSSLESLYRLINIQQ